MTTQVAEYWNQNVHYQRVILDAVPPGCGAAIDVGCGDGMLACKLATRCGAVTGIDKDAPMIALARQRARGAASTADGTPTPAAGLQDGPATPNVAFIEGDFLEYPFEAGRFDFACANTVLHHMDFEAALAAMARILRPGGRLAVLGLGADVPPLDYVIGAVGAPVNLYYKFTRGEGSPGAPIMDPDMSWSQVRAAARRVLPGVRYRRRLLWRYSLIWDKPDNLP